MPHEPVSHDLAAVSAFLFREARLMDGHAYEEWLSLWEQDAHYWVPANDDDYDTAVHVSLVNEDRIGIENRVIRLTSGAHYAQDPPSRLSRVVGNVEIAAADGAEVIVLSTFNITAMRRSRLDIFAGTATHRLRLVDGAYRIVSKKILLVNNDEVINNLTFLI